MDCLELLIKERVILVNIFDLTLRREHDSLPIWKDHWLIIGYSVPVQLLWTVHESEQRKFDLLV